MVYYAEGPLVIRDLQPGDGEKLAAGEMAQGWQDTREKYNARLRDQAAGKAVAMAALLDGEPVGYINVYPDASWGPFGGQGLPEIVDFGVLEKFRRRGIGGKLMDAAEKVAARYGDTVYLGVGLHSGYGAAQRMYVKRGYVPDGSGAWYGETVCPAYADCRNDDDLVLYLSKKLR